MRSIVNNVSRVSKFSALFSISISLLTVLIITHATWQLIWAYFSGEGLDIAPKEFIFPAIMFLLTTYFSVRRLNVLVTLLAVRIRGSKMTIVTEFFLGRHSPVEAGILMDGNYGNRELAGMIKSLELKGAIEIIHTGRDMIISSLGNVDNLNNFDRHIYERLFKSDNRLSISSHKTYIEEMSKNLFTHVKNDLFKKGILTEAKPVDRLIRILDKISGIIAPLVAVVLFLGLFIREATVVQYPRYDVHLWQLLFLLLLILSLALYSIYIFYSVYSNEGWKNYTEVYGFYVFLRVAMKDRLTTGKLSKSDKIKLEPYAIAMGIIKNDPITKSLDKIMPSGFFGKLKANL